MTKRWMTTTSLAILVCAVAALTIFQQFFPEQMSLQKNTGALTNAPFTNELKAEWVTPITKFDPVSVTSPVYRHVHAYTENGTPIVLDARKHPLLFVAYWCPHCQRTLVMISSNKDRLEQRPIVVSMGFAPGTRLPQAVQIEQSEIHQLHLQGLTVDYLLDPAQSRYVPVAYPTLVFSQRNHLKMLDSEHTLSVWQQALRR